jgi:hypothetical protein
MASDEPNGDSQRNGGQRRKHPHRGRHTADHVLALCLAHGLTVGQAAEKAGVSRRLVSLRLRNDSFQELLTQARAALLERGRSALVAGLGQAIRRLRNLAASDDEDVAVKAATALAKLTAPAQLVTALALDTLGAAKLLEMAEVDADEDFGALDEDDEGEDTEPSAAPSVVGVPASPGGAADAPTTGGHVPAPPPAPAPSPPPLPAAPAKLKAVPKDRGVDLVRKVIATYGGPAQDRGG